MNNPPIPRDPGPRPGHNFENKGHGRGGKNGGRNNGGRGGKGRGNKGKGPRFVGGNGHGFQGVNMHQLNALIQAQMQEILNPIRDERKDVKRQTRDALAQARSQYQNSVGGINNIFGQTGQYISGRNAETAKAWDTARAATSADQTALIAQLGMNNAGAQGSVTNEMSRLGMDGSQFTGGIAADAAFSQGLAGQQGSNNMANLNLMASAAGSVGNLLLGMNAGSQSSALSSAMKDRNSAITGIRNDKRDQLNDINEAIREARSGRKGLLQQLYQQLLQTNWGMYVDQQNLQQQQQQINMQRQAQRFAQRQQRRANRASRKGSRGGSSSRSIAPSSGGSSGGGSSGGSGGSSGGSGGYYGTNNNLMLGALTGHHKHHKKG